MGVLSDSMRIEEAERLAAMISTPGKAWSSWILQGLPGCGGKQVLATLLVSLQSAATTQDVILVQLDFAGLWPQPVLASVWAILNALKTASGQHYPIDTETDLGQSLVLLRNLVQEISAAGRQIVM